MADDPIDPLAGTRYALEGRVVTMDGKDLAYGKPGFENPHFVASGKP